MKMEKKFQTAAKIVKLVDKLNIDFYSLDVDAMDKFIHFNDDIKIFVNKTKTTMKLVSDNGNELDVDLTKAKKQSEPEYNKEADELLEQLSKALDEALSKHKSDKECEGKCTCGCNHSIDKMPKQKLDDLFERMLEESNEESSNNDGDKVEENPFELNHPKLNMKSIEMFCDQFDNEIDEVHVTDDYVVVKFDNGVGFQFNNDVTISIHKEVELV